jgi:hypothetical protein
VGFESPFAARRRLADAMTTRVDCFSASPGPAALALADVERPVPISIDGELDRLASDILDAPGAGGALLAAFAAQARALSLVAEAASRAPHAPLPADVLGRVRDAIRSASSATSFA